MTDLRRQAPSILFADARGYSDLTEHQLRQFLTYVLPAFAGALESHSSWGRNSWGDAVVAFFDTPSDAARCALTIRDTLLRGNWSELGLPDDLAVRVGLHTAPIFFGHDPVRQTQGVVGSQLNLAARIEPIVPANHVYATRTFVELLRTQADPKLAWDRLGRLELAKGWGSEELYNIRWRDENPVEVQSASDEELESLREEHGEGARSQTVAATRADRFGWGHLFDSLVDAALYLEDERGIARDDIINAIRQNKLIKTRYHYAEDTGADRWLRLCEDPGYRHHVRTKGYWASRRGKRMAECVRREFDGAAFDFISLGPGDGRKDGSLVLNWLSEGVDLFYFPYDISLRLVARATHEVRRHTRQVQTGLLRVKAVVADFSDFPKVADVFQYRPTPNVVALLGTLGNLGNERDFLRDLLPTLGERDLLLLEVRLKSDSALAGLDSDLRE